METSNIAGEISPDLKITQNIATELFQVVCQNGGSIDIVKAIVSLSREGQDYIDKYSVYPLVKDNLKLDDVHPGSQPRLRAVVNVELCSDYKQSSCEDVHCSGLHVCPFFIRGDCRFGQRCRYRHHFQNSHEQMILKDFKLDALDEPSLVAFLRQAIFGSASSESGQVCPQYSVASGCPLGKACPKLHLCRWFANGKCKKGKRCGRSHALAEENERLVNNAKAAQQQVAAARIQWMRNAERLVAAARARQAAEAEGKAANLPKMDEICGFHLKGSCSYGNSCPRYLYNLPYLWQIQVTGTDGKEKWVNFPTSYNQKIEQDFCDVKRDNSLEINMMAQLLHIHFLDMVAKDTTGNISVSVRRLSTASWLKASSGDTFATLWTWYWIDDHGRWTPYDGAESLNPQNNFGNSSNEKLEESFLSGTETFTLSLKQQTYNIDFRKLQQINTETGKVRKIRRRPSKFIGQEDMADIASRPRQPSLPFQIGGVQLPREWTPMTAEQEVVLVPLEPNSEEYCRVKREFGKTLSKKTIHKVERIQNVDLWESYFRKFCKLSRKLGRDPDVRCLFYGTNETSVKAICQQGFDWRLCGVHGTAYGKGSYFAVNALYSDGYTDASQQGHKMMFLCKVIVGSFVAGKSNTVRPPPIDPSKPHVLYHSCVDNTSKPTIFVIFENDQAYPELLISYS